MKITNKNPRRLKEESLKNADLFRCKFCGQLQGCTPDGKIGMYSLKILRHHELICTRRPN